ncbi:hypothetical protein AgCh_002019 [Apium graveolens]
MEGQRPLVSPPIKNWGLTITSQYAFLSCLSSFMVQYSGVLGVEEPHQSIPNLVVKLYCGDDTVGEPQGYGTKDYPGPTPRYCIDGDLKSRRTGGPSYLFLLRAQAMEEGEEGTEKKVSATTDPSFPKASPSFLRLPSSTHHFKEEFEIWNGSEMKWMEDGCMLDLRLIWVVCEWVKIWEIA